MPLNGGTVTLVLMMIIQISLLIYSSYKFPQYKAIYWFAAVISIIVYGGIVTMIIIVNHKEAIMGV